MSSKILIRPLITEKAIQLVENNNTLAFLVDPRADKRQIKEAIESTFGVKVVKVNTLITPRGRKKAYIKLAPGYSAMDVLVNMGVL